VKTTKENLSTEFPQIIRGLVFLILASSWLTACASRQGSEGRALEQVRQTQATTDEAPELSPEATSILRRVRPLGSSEFVTTLVSDPVGVRTINAVVLHHTVRPSAAEFKNGTLLGLARIQLSGISSRLSWHFAIAPDGTVWTGMPLAEPAEHVRTIPRPRVPGLPTQNQRTVSILLVLNGDTEEMPTEQGVVLTQVLRILFDRLKLNAETSFKFHSDLDPDRGCPGKLIDKETILRRLRTSD
jgi:hypothetical protein